MSPETLAAVIGGVAGGVVGGVLGIVGVAVGLFGERWVRRWGDVRCVIEDDDWYVARGRSGGVVDERRLRVAFLNRKELPVTLWDVRVEFSKGGEPLDEWARPHVQLVNPDGSIRERHGPVLGPVTLSPHIPVPLEIRVLPEGPVQGTDQKRADKMRALEETDSATFVATLIGAGDKRKKLKEP